jgi:hypothetical protein
MYVSPPFLLIHYHAPSKTTGSKTLFYVHTSKSTTSKKKSILCYFALY